MLNAGSDLSILGAFADSLFRPQFVLPFSMLLLVPVGYFRLKWFFPALMVLLGAHYLPFAFLYGMRMFWALAGILIAMGVVIALYFSQTFSLGAWVAGLALFVFAWIGRSIASRDASAPLSREFA